MKTYEEITLELKSILQENGIEVYDDYNETKLEVDSLTIVSIIVSIEDHFNISFPDSVFGNDDILYIEKLINMILSLVNNREAI